MSNPKYIKDLTIGQRLAHIVEECGEVLVAAGKCQRWGFHSVNPELPKSEQEQNWAWLFREIDDLEGALKRFKEDFKSIAVANSTHKDKRVFLDEKP